MNIPPLFVINPEVVPVTAFINLLCKIQQSRIRVGNIFKFRLKFTLIALEIWIKRWYVVQQCIFSSYQIDDKVAWGF